MKVSQKVFLRNEEGKILALRRSKNDESNPPYWDVPGGTVEEGENLEESLQREVFEEIGTLPTKTTIFDAASEMARDGIFKVTIAYIGEADLSNIVLSDEHDHYRFVTKEEFLALETNKRIKRFLEKLEN